MQLSQEIKNKVKENASKTSCFLWILCGFYCIYTIPHVRLFSLFTLGYFTLGIFISSLTFGVLLYLLKLIVFYVTTPRSEPQSNMALTFWSILAVIYTPIQWLVDIALVYIMYQTVKYIFVNYYF